MSSVTVKVDGETEAVAALSQFPGALDEALTLGIHAVALVALSDYRRRILNGPKSGRLYKRGKRGHVVHQASAPGEAPANDHGTLIRSTYIEVGDEKLTSVIGATIDYAPYLEYGTRNMAARPAMRPAAMEAEKQAPDILDAYVKDALANLR